uniref:Uncharacterized protein n=1 Tax=Octopus bimaculoides TaxID=37653 RepID=A0A0L8HZM0_OCTBM
MQFKFRFKKTAHNSTIYCFFSCFSLNLVVQETVSSFSTVSIIGALLESTSNGISFGLVGCLLSNNHSPLLIIFILLLYISFVNMPL